MEKTLHSVVGCLKHTVHDGKTGCLIWKGSTRGQMKYAQFSGKVGSGSRAGHKEVYLYFYGEIPYGYDVGHTCDNPRCINPLHLVLQTRGTNIRQAVRNGRHVSNWHKAEIKPGMEEFSRRVSAGVRRYIHDNPEGATARATAMGRANAGRKLTAEHRQKIAAALSGKKRGPYKKREKKDGCQ